MDLEKNFSEPRSVSRSRGGLSPVSPFLSMPEWFGLEGTYKIILLAAEVEQGRMWLGCQRFSLQLWLYWGPHCTGYCQWGSSTDTLVPVQLLLPQQQQMWPWRLRGHTNPCLVQMMVSHSSEIPPGSCPLRCKWGKPYSLMMSQAIRLVWLYLQCYLSDPPCRVHCPTFSTQSGCYSVQCTSAWV